MIKDRLAALQAALLDDEFDGIGLEAGGVTQVFEQEYGCLNCVLWTKSVSATIPSIEDKPQGDGFMEEFFAEVEKLWALLEKVENDIEQVKDIQEDLLLAPADEGNLKHQLDGLMSGIKATSDEIRHELKSIEQNNKEAEEFSESPAELRIRKTQNAAISRKFIQVMTDYNGVQTDYTEKWAARLQRQLEILRVDEGVEDSPVPSTSAQAEASGILQLVSERFSHLPRYWQQQ